MTATDQVEQNARAAPALAAATTRMQTHGSRAVEASEEGASSSSDPPTQNALPTYLQASAVTNTAGLETIASASTSQVSNPTSTGLPVDTFFDIAPRSDSTSFQVGYLGLKGFQAWLKGDVLLKLDTVTKRKGRYTRCTVQLQAEEQAPGPRTSDAPGASGSVTFGQNVVELFSHSLVLWDADKEPTSSTADLPTVPSIMPFSFPLTPDLPHCVHLRDSSLIYTLSARIFSEDAGKLPHAVKTVPVHLVRYTRPGPLDEIELAEIDGAISNQEYSLTPHSWVEQAPTLVYAQINRTIFRRAEPIELRIHIPSPDPTAVSEKGLKLRAVEADLVRIIHVKSHTAQNDGDLDILHGASAAAQGRATDPDVHEALLAHSGKLCRFHSKRPVLLRLTLHPPFDRANMPHPHPDHDALASGPVYGRGGGGGCESISQETLMHRVSFEVRIKIGILGGRGERRDIIFRRSVKILPGAAGALEDLNGEGGENVAGQSSTSEKERLKRSEKARMLAEDHDTGGSSSRSPDYVVDKLDFGMDDEYDGYEDVGRSLDDWSDLNGRSSEATGSSGQDADHTERLEQLRHFLDASDPSTHNDGPPPTIFESRNDLQVEVEVEGVGLAMPRHDFRHPADPYPNTPGLSDEAFPPPPPIDAQTDELASSYAMLEPASREDRLLSCRMQQNLPPRHASQTRTDQAAETNTDSQTLRMTGGPVVRSTDHSQTDALSSSSELTPPHGSSNRYIGGLGPSVQPLQISNDESHPSYEAAVSGGPSRLPEGSTAVTSYEPPPYAHGSVNAEPVPSFYQAIHGGTAGDLGPPRSAIAHRVPQPDISPPQAAHGQSSIRNAEYQPPAYATSPHPPSYDA